MRRVSVAKILFQGKSKSKLVLTGIGMFISMLIISSVFQIYSDFGSLLNENKKEGAFEYIQISKEIGVSTALGLSSSKFSKKEVDRIKSQLFVEDVGELWSNDFRVYGKFAGNAFDMFFTSIEDDFIDADLDDFTWREGQQEIPVIISNQFLTILNHAVLPSQGQRPIPKVAIKQASVDLTLSKKGKWLKHRARVVGFSDRITSVLVPKNFLDYANEALSGSVVQDVSMVVLKVSDASSKELRSFLRANDYEVEGELPLLDNAKLLLKVALGVLFAFGIIILGVSVSLNLAQFQLLVLENKERIKMLVLLGYSPKSIIHSILKTGFLNMGVTVLLVLLSVLLLFNRVHGVLVDAKLGYPELHLVTFLIPLVIAGVIMFGVKRKLKKLVC